MSSLSGKEILIVDDAAEIRLLARKILETDGAVVREAASVDEGVKLVSVLRPHLILLDLNFPEQSGFTFLNFRLASASWSDIPTVVLSGLNDRESVVRAFSLGASDYLLKPFRATMLLQKVRKALKLVTFHQHQFPEGARPCVQVILPAQLQKVSEIGFKVESSAKLESDEKITIESDLLQSLGAQDALIKTSSRPAHYDGQGRYLNDVLFTGVGEDFTKGLRRTLKKAL